MRQTGIEVIGPAAWGTHFCGFYATAADLAELLVPYFKAGLEAGEFCMWITSPPLGAAQACDALARAVPDLEDYRRRGRIEILPHTQWYLCDGRFDQERVLRGWVDRLEDALARGCTGLRLTGNTFWLEKADWKSFAEYEAAVDAVVGQYRMLAFCTYSLDRCGAAEIADVIRNHRFALMKRDGRWELFESFDRRRMVELHARELAFERERLATTLHSIGDAVIATDTAGRVVLLNGVAEAMTGWGQAEAEGRPLAEVFRIVDARSGAPAEDAVSKVLRAGRVVALANHTALVTRAGERIAIEDSAAPIRGAGGETSGVVLVFRDVTTTRRVEERLALLSRTSSRLLASQDPQAVVTGLCGDVMAHLDCDVFLNFLVDAGAGRLHLNACGGVPDEDARRLEWLDYGGTICGCVARDGQRIVAEDVQRWGDPRADVVRALGVRAYCCHPLVAADRVLGTLSFGSKSRARFDEEEVELMRTVADQVATAIERAGTLRAISVANQRLLEADQRKNEFLAALSHELRNPLAPVKNSLFILERSEPGGAQARRALEVIGRQVDQLSRLVNDLLDTTRVSRNKIELRRERLELNEAVRRAVEDNRSLFERADVRLELEPALAPLHVSADATRLAQVVGNLLQNAAKFTPAGGRVQVSVARDRAEAVVRVSDDGIGMAPETLARLFEPFMQGKQALDRSSGGLGLGLALVKGLVELHGGRISGCSAGLGRGSEFVVRLPLDRGEAPGRVAPEPAAARRVPRRVLVIEDNVDSAESLREALRLQGHEVAVAYDGYDGFALAREFRPEVVLCDIGLPGIDGYEVARSFANADELKHVLLVALSGYARAEDLERAAAAGFRHHLAKPPNLAEIEALLATLPSR